MSNECLACLQSTLRQPGEPTSAVLVYLHKGQSVQDHTHLTSKEEAEKLLVAVRRIADSIEGFIENGRM